MCGKRSHLIGDTPIALEDHNHTALGVGTVAASDDQLAVGRYNASRPDALFIVGQGDGDSSRSNAIEVTPSQLKIGSNGIYKSSSLKLSHYDGYGENTSGVTIGPFNWKTAGSFMVGKYCYAGSVGTDEFGDIAPVSSYDKTTKILTLSRGLVTGLPDRVIKGIVTRKNTSMPIRVQFNPIGTNESNIIATRVQLVDPIYGSISSATDLEYLCLVWDGDDDNMGLSVGNNHIVNDRGFAFGNRLMVSSYQMVLGQWNRLVDGLISSSSASGALVIGNGKRDARSNVYRINSSGSTYAGGSYNTSGADYAEMFEWWDGNPNNEDRRGKFVVLHEGKIRFWGESPEDNSDVLPTVDYPSDYIPNTDEFSDILGIVSATPAILGDSYEDQWKGMYQTDIFGEALYEEYIDPAYTDEEGKFHKEERRMAPKINPDYDPNEPYIPRSQRKEWAAVGLHGKLVVVDDGTCVVGKYCKPSMDEPGKGTGSEDKQHFHVLERLDSTHIRVLIK